MPHDPILTTVVGSYPFPGWLEHATATPAAFGPADVAEMQDDATTAAIMDQVRSGLDVITDGEQSRFDFNLSFYAYLQGIETDHSTTRRYGPPAHDQRGRHTIVGRCYLGAHLCFGNFKGRAVAPRSYAPMLPAFLGLAADEIHVEMAGREFAELDVIARLGEDHDVAVGVVDVKSYYIETPEDVADRIVRCLAHVPADRLSVAPDCGLSQTARWAARQKLVTMVAGARQARESL